MANLTPTPGWDSVFQLETDTPVLGGAGGVANSQAQALLNRFGFLEGDTGSSKVGHTPAGTGAVATTVQEVLRRQVNVLDFFTDAEKLDVVSLTGSINVISKIRLAFDKIKSTGGTLYFPRGKYRVGGGFGTNFADPSDLADNVIIKGDSATILVDFSLLTANTNIIVLEGDNVGVEGLHFQSTRAFDLFDTDPAVYRSIQILAIEIGGKASSYNGLTDNITRYKNNAFVRGCSFTNINSPIVVTATSNARVEDNDIFSYTQTGIVVWGCPSNVVVTKNRVILGADDCIFLYNPNAAGSAWTAAGNYAGGHVVTDNYLGSTRSKFIGTGGYSDVTISRNTCDLSLTQGIAVEADPAIYSNGSLYNKNIVVENNIINRAGRFYNTNSLYVFWQGPVATEDVGISTRRAPATTGTRPNGVYIRANKVINPNGNAVDLGFVDSVTVVDNELVAGQNQQGSGLVNTNGYGVFTTDITNGFIALNNIYSGGANWLFSYAIVNSGAALKDIHIKNNNVPGGETFAPLGISGLSPFTSNILDYATPVPYYEEGSYAPVVTSTGTTPTVTYTTQTGFYTRIGRMVYCQIVLNFNITVAGTGAVVVSLPFVHNGDNQTTNFAHQKIGISTGVEIYDNIAPAFASATANLFTSSTGAESNAAVTGSRALVVYFMYAVY